jgi:hypothetical protein
MAAVFVMGEAKTAEAADHCYDQKRLLSRADFRSCASLLSLMGVRSQTWISGKEDFRRPSYEHFISAYYHSSNKYQGV